MGFKQETNDPIIGKMRKGYGNDSYKRIMETLQVINGKALLSEIPNRFEKVIVTGLTHPMKEVLDGELSENTYRVDYTNGIVFFHAKIEAQYLVFKYMGRGVHLSPASRIYLHAGNGIINAEDKFKDVDRELTNQSSRVDALIRENPQPSEVIDTRVDRNGKVFPTAKHRIDEEQKKIEESYTDSNGKRYTSLKERMDAELKNVEDAYFGKDGRSYYSLKDRFDTSDDVMQSSAYYHGVKTEKYKDPVSQTTYYITIIPHKDKDGNLIKLKRGFGKDAPNGGQRETAREFANRHNATVTINANTYNVDNFKARSVDVYNGKVLNPPDSTLVYNHVLAFKPDNTLSYFPSHTDPTTIINNGFDNALTGFIPLIMNGASIGTGVLATYPGGTQSHPRQVIGQFPNKDILILTCDGRTVDDKGMTSEDLIRILLPYRLTFAFMLDGGGSTSTVVRGTLINKPIDFNGTGERSIPFFLYFAKEPQTKRDIDIAETNELIGQVMKKSTDIETRLMNKVNMHLGYTRLKAPAGFKQQGIEVWEGNAKKTKLYTRENEFAYYDFIKKDFMFRVTEDGTLSTRKGSLGDFYKFTKYAPDLNLITTTGMYWATSTTKNNPGGAVSWSVMHFQPDSGTFLQVAFPFSEIREYPKMRRMVGGKIEDWTTLGTNIWLTLPLQNGAQINNGRSPKYTKIGNIVYMIGEIQNKLGDIATLPAGYRPKNYPLTFITALAASNPELTSKISIDVNGVVTVLGNSNTSSGITLNISFVVE
ncbi:MAG: phosphodiester glycosidase family protein [Bacillaceae bacterium]